MKPYFVVALLVFSTTPTDDFMTRLAQGGNIQENAPVKASLAITINASPEKVWGLLTDINHWPTWQPEITQAKISGPLQSGTEFSWTSGTQIQSRIALVNPLTQFAWTGKAYRARAIHIWKLERLSDGRTAVKTDESMDGPLLTLFFSSNKLKESDQHWLDSLKAAAEK